MAKQKRGSTYKPVSLNVYGVHISVGSDEQATLIQEWIDADPLNAMRQRGRDVMDVRSLAYVQHPHPRGPSPMAVSRS